MPKNILHFAEPNVAFFSNDIQAAIDAKAAAGGGVVFLPAATYTLNAPLVPKRGVTVRGVYPGATSTSVSSWDCGFDVDRGTIITYPGGTVFQQDMSGGVGTLSSLDGFVLESIGFKNIGKIISSGASSKSGMDACVIRDIVASNVTDVAFDMTNFIQCHFSNIRAECKQFFRITCDYDPAVIAHQPGNSTFDDLYCYITAAGHDVPSVHCRIVDYAAGTSYLNFLRWGRLQINRMSSGAQDPGSAHIYLEGSEHGVINGCSFYDLDLEGAAEYNLKAYNAYVGNFSFTAMTDRCTSSVQLRGCNTVQMACNAFSMTLDMDDTCFSVFASGAIDGLHGTRQPMGVYVDRSVNASVAQIRTSMVPG